MKLKWYDRDRVGEIPKGVVGLKFNDDEIMTLNIDSPRRAECANYWMKEPDSGVIEVIAYTLGELLEVDK